MASPESSDTPEVPAFCSSCWSIHLSGQCPRETKSLEQLSEEAENIERTAAAKVAAYAQKAAEEKQQ